jgi:hypothetical protein
MNYARLSSLLVASVLSAVFAASCVSTQDSADVVPAPPGAFQPDGGGKSLDEASACAQLTAAESAARLALSCDPVMRTCPDYIRPAGSTACFTYDQASVTGCATLYDSFTSCDDFDQQPCLVIAQPCEGEDSGAGTGGAGGQSGLGQGAAGGDSGAGGASGASN